MNSSGLGGSFLSGPNGGILDLDTPFHRHQQNQLSHHPSAVTCQHHMNITTGMEKDNPIGLIEVKNLNAALSFGKGKAVLPSNPANSNELSDGDDDDDDAEDGNCGKKGTPWQRMKWTDNVVGLLIAVVSCVGDDGTIGGVEGVKRKSGVLQKKGKWKTVSKIMISKGCHVSPQQCEDKFNDLNKRYKRLNDILGRGTCCQVVENPSLMDSMPNLSAKAKDDVRKILSSKHLFYKEMCAYHNGQRIPNGYDLDLQSYFLEHGRNSRDNNDFDDEDEDEDNNNESEDDGLDIGININAHGNGGRMEELCGRLKLSEEGGDFQPRTDGMEKLKVEMERFFQDPSKSSRERREWVKIQSLKLQEQNVSYQARALELQKQRFKWLRYRSKKDRELDRLSSENQRMKLENDHKILKLKQKEHEGDIGRSEMSLDHASHGISRSRGREHINLARQQ